MSDREEFERLIRADGYFTSLNWSGNRYVVAELQATWEGYQMRPPEIDALKAEVGRLRAALKPFASFAKHFPKERTYGTRPTTGEWYSVASGSLGRDEITVEDLHNADAAMKEMK